MDKILEIKDLVVNFKTYAGTAKAIRNINLDLNKKETLAIVGESGSGKSVTVRSILKLLSSNADIASGKILFHDQDLLSYNQKQIEKIRGNQIGIVFQDPMTSLDPTMNIGNQVAEPLMIHHKISKKDALNKAEKMLELVGIKDAKKRLKDYPHQFSGGQRQRIVIAIAMINDPEILIADEPTTALDVTIQHQIINLMQDLQKQKDTSIIFISHDLGIVAGIADRIAVMYAGKIVEYGTTEEIFYDPRHPYTWGLLNSLPNINADKNQPLLTIPGNPPNLIDPPIGDAFAARNSYALKIDFEKQPPFFKVSNTHYAATWLLDPNAPKIPIPESIVKRREHYRELAKIRKRGNL